MTATECIRILRKNPGISVRKAMDLTGLSRENVKKYAAYAGIELLTVRKAKSLYCDHKPHKCGQCPFTDCIDQSHPTMEETAYIENALGDRRKKEREKE